MGKFLTICPPVFHGFTTKKSTPIFSKKRSQTSNHQFVIFKNLSHLFIKKANKKSTLYVECFFNILLRFAGLITP